MLPPPPQARPRAAPAYLGYLGRNRKAQASADSAVAPVHAAPVEALVYALALLWDKSVAPGRGLREPDLLWKRPALSIDQTGGGSRLRALNRGDIFLPAWFARLLPRRSPGVYPNCHQTYTQIHRPCNRSALHSNGRTHPQVVTAQGSELPAPYRKLWVATLQR